jgi:hypothetical protein
LRYSVGSIEESSDSREANDVKDDADSPEARPRAWAGGKEEVEPPAR